MVQIVSSRATTMRHMISKYVIDNDYVYIIYRYPKTKAGARYHPVDGVISYNPKDCPHKIVVEIEGQEMCENCATWIINGKPFYRDYTICPVCHGDGAIKLDVEKDDEITGGQLTINDLIKKETMLCGFCKGTGVP